MKHFADIIQKKGDKSKPTVIVNEQVIGTHIRRVILVSAHQIQHRGRRFQLQISFLLVLQCTVSCRFYLSMSQLKLDLTS